MTVTRLRFAETFDDGTPGDPITTENSIFTSVSPAEDSYPALFYADGHTGQGASQVPYDIAYVQGALLEWRPTYPNPVYPTLAGYWQVSEFQNPGALPTFAEFLTVVLSIFPDEATALAAFQAGTPLTFPVSRLVGAEFWWRVSTRSATISAVVSSGITSLATGVFFLRLDTDGSQVFHAGSAGDSVAVVPGEWFRTTIAVTGPVSTSVTIYDDSGLIVSEDPDFASPFDPIFRLDALAFGLDPDAITFRPLEVDDFTFQLDLFSLDGPRYPDPAHTRIYPRDTATRIYPPPRTSRIVGGHL